ncbi:MAG: Fe-S oxidoreductase [Firmicutes bacterium]|nr:Fe-S oxidoreductase [Bacillota bacterium]
MKKLGFGMMRLPLLRNNKQSAVHQDEVNKMADYFLENGFKYIDTAYMYHDFMSENAVKRAFVERHPREDFLLADKMPVAMVRTAADYQRFFDEQLEKCGVDYFDYYLLHDITRQCIDKVETTGGFDFIQELKTRGKVKQIGFSYHDTADVLDEILSNHPEVDFVQLQINYVDWNCDIIQSRRNYEVCVKHGKPVVVMEPIKGGTLANIPTEAEKLFKGFAPEKSAASWALRFAASLENVMMVLGGMSNFEQMLDNVATMAELKPINSEEHNLIDQAVGIINDATAVACTNCRYCVNHEPGCLVDIAIPEYLSLYNDVHRFGRSWPTTQAYRNLTKEHGSPADCTACGNCESHCPQHIDIIEQLQRVAEIFG